MQPCPSEHDLDRLHGDDLPLAEAATVRAHLKHCRDCTARDAALVRRRDALIERLKAVRVAGGGSSEQHLPAAVTASSPVSANLDRGPAMAVAGYTIHGEIHRGGQGVVYEARQDSTGRTVALKVMRDGPFAGPRDRMRFEREVQVLAQLNHPGIVAIHDSGTSAGVHYFVMDRVQGVALDRYLSACASAVRPSLELLARVCDAVNAAHLRGVIHRDLKPSNVLVDAAGQPRVLDFGLAKVLDADGSSAATMTESGQFLGSLPWASPEQAEGRVERIDVRTDVYALGVMLFQALTGVFPYDVTGGLRTVLDRIVQDEPPRPSSLRRSLDDDVDTIVLKCLAKAPERRYQSVGELAADLRRYLAGEPIEAKREQTWYVLGKLLRRHRAAVAVAAGFVLLTTGSAIALSLLYGQAQTQARIASEQRDRAKEAETAAETRRQVAEQETAKAREVQQFLQNMLRAVDPDEARGSEVTVRQVLQRAAERAEQELADQPEVQAAIHETIGQTYAALGDYPQADTHLQQALQTRKQRLGDAHEDTAAALQQLGSLRSKQGQYAEAEPLLRQALAIRRQRLGDTHLETARTLAEIAGLERETGRLDEAQSDYRAALRVLADLGEAGDADRGSVQHNFAGLLAQRGNVQEAETLYESSLAIVRATEGENSPKAAIIQNSLARLQMNRGDFAAAAERFLEVVRLFKHYYGDRHPNVATALTNAAYALHEAGRYAEAEPLYREALALHRELLGDEHPNVAATLNNLAELLRDEGRFEEAEPLYRQTIAILDQSPGREHPNTALTLANLGHVLHARGDEDAAQPLYQESLEILKRTLGPDHALVGRGLRNLAGVRLARKDYDGAERLYDEAQALYRQADDTLSIAMGLLDLSRVAEGRENYPAAIDFARQALELRRSKLGEEHVETLSARCSEGRLLVLQGRAAEAESPLLDILQTAQRTLSTDDARLATFKLAYGQCLSALARYDEAEPLLVEASQRLTARFGPQSPHAKSARQALAKLQAARDSAARE